MEGSNAGWEDCPARAQWDSGGIGQYDCLANPRRSVSGHHGPCGEVRLHDLLVNAGHHRRAAGRASQRRPRRSEHIRCGSGATRAEDREEKRAGADAGGRSRGEEADGELMPVMPESLSSVADHLWQSTVFACVAGLLTLALRKNAARVRHRIWVVASVKFLVPFSLLIALGRHVQWRKASVPAPVSFPVVLDQVSSLFAATANSFPASRMAPHFNLLPILLWTVWLCGFLCVAFSSWRRWRRVDAAVRAGSAMNLGLPVETVSSPSFLEPGVFGVFRPVLLLPEGILDQLTPEQWKSVVAHELCHVRHRDNLLGIVQMFVEAVFWFHPLVWWIGKRICHERERGCDEEVLRMGSEPRIYA